MALSSVRNLFVNASNMIVLFVFSRYMSVFITRTLSCGAVYCNRPTLSVCVFVCGSITTITRNCIYPSSPNCNSKVRVVTISSSHFVSIPRHREEVCGGVNLFYFIFIFYFYFFSFVFVLLQPTRNDCVASEHFFSLNIVTISVCHL